MITLSLERNVIHRGYDRRSCWVHARCGFVHRPDGSERIVVTMQKSLMGTHAGVWDVFSGLWSMQSSDGGATWDGPAEQAGLKSWREPEGVEVVASDFTPQWHAASGKLLGIGHTCRYRNGALVPSPRLRESVYAVWDDETATWGPLAVLDMPDRDRFYSAGAGSIQWTELPNGDLLLPIYFREKDRERTKPGAVEHKVVVLRCRFDGTTLRLLEIGSELAMHVRRGLGEPSLIECNDLFWLTIRSGDGCYVATSHDGLHFTPPQPWLFDDGEPLGSHDTQQHWARIEEKLFLVYTRRGAQNDHIPRNRAPLFIAEVDQERRCILRATEEIAIPERGAMLGNFGVGQCSAGEAWICASEWMECAGEWNPIVWNSLKAKFPAADLDALAATPGRSGLCELSGSDNSVWLVRIS